MCVYYVNSIETLRSMAKSASAEVVSITTLRGTGSSSSSSSAKVSKASKKRSKSISDITNTCTDTTAAATITTAVTSTDTATAATVAVGNNEPEQRYVAVVAVRRLTYEVRTSTSDDVDSDVANGGMTSSMTCQSDEQQRQQQPRVIRVAVLGSVDAVSVTPL
jgi:hypothetical protein